MNMNGSWRYVSVLRYFTGSQVRSQMHKMNCNAVLHDDDDDADDDHEADDENLLSTKAHLCERFSL